LMPCLMVTAHVGAALPRQSRLAPAERSAGKNHSLAEGSSGQARAPRSCPNTLLTRGGGGRFNEKGRPNRPPLLNWSDVEQLVHAVARMCPAEMPATIAVGMAMAVPAPDQDDVRGRVQWLQRQGRRRTGEQANKRKRGQNSNCHGQFPPQGRNDKRREPIGFQLWEQLFAAADLGVRKPDLLYVLFYAFHPRHGCTANPTYCALS
jgi:hypothetical protein